MSKTLLTVKPYKIKNNTGNSNSKSICISPIFPCEIGDRFHQEMQSDGSLKLIPVKDGVPE